MAKVIIERNLEKDINKKFKQESVNIFRLMYELEENPKKGKHICDVGTVTIKEIKYKTFRFYFIANRFKIKFLSLDELNDLIIKFVRMSDKKSQQKTIEQIKKLLRNISRENF